MFGPKNRLVVLVENMPMGARVVPYRDDPTKLVLKSVYPEGAVSLAKAMGCKLIEMGGTEESRTGQYMVAVDKKDFLDGLRELAETVIDSNEPTQVYTPPVPEKCPECGTDDGTHFNYCGGEG